MQNRSIVTKLVASACGIVSFLLIAGSFALLHFETRMGKIFTDRYLEKTNQSVHIREQEERALLEKTVLLNSKILAKTAARYLYDFDTDEIGNLLPPYMQYSEILAIEVLNENRKPVSAIWREHDVVQGDALPDSFDSEQSLSFQVDALMNDEYAGTFHIYYTDAVIREKIRKIRDEGFREAEIFRMDFRSHLNHIVIGQGGGIFFIILTLTLCLIIFWRAMILRHLTEVSDIAGRLADLDLRVIMETDREDEIGRMLGAIHKMLLAFRKIVAHVRSKGKKVTRVAGRMSENISIVASAAEEISFSALNISENTGQMSRNIEAIGAAAEELSVSVNELGKHAHQGAHISQNAVTMAGKAEDTMRMLDSAADEISEVTKMIRKVADKMTLLGLNAHIEAASAGLAGRGFAVVAAEIREFAFQSALAADDIGGRILLMQANARDAVSVIGNISQIISTIRQSSETISLSLEEQMGAADEIASNVAEASAHAGEIAMTMGELTKGISHVSVSVGVSARGKGEKGDGIGDIPHMDASAEEVAKLAGELLELVGRFRME